MSRAGENSGGRGDDRGSSPAGGGSPRTPRGGRLRDRVSFFEQVWSSGGGARTSSSEDLVDAGGLIGADDRRSPLSPVNPRSLSRASDSSFEESFERLVEEGELVNGAKVVKFEKMTFRKSLREVTSSSSVTLRGVAAGGQTLTESSRTPSEERAFEDSAYQSHSHGIHGGSRGSSVASLARFGSEENLTQARRSSSPGGNQHDDKAPSEWYAEYRNQSFHNVATRMEYVRSRSEYDAHIAEIKGNFFFRILSRLSQWQRVLRQYWRSNGAVPRVYKFPLGVVSFTMLSINMSALTGS